MNREYGEVVVGVDGSPDSLGALRWAADEAVRRARRLRVVHACGTEPPTAAVRDIAVHAAAEAWRWLPGVETVASTDTGSPISVLRRYSTSAPLVVLGSRGGGVHDTLGSVSAALSDQADCPVLVVHDGRRWAAPDATLDCDGPIVVGFDSSHAAQHALRLAFHEAATRAARLVTIHVWWHPDLWHAGTGHGTDLTAWSSGADDVLRRAVHPWRERYPRIDVELRPLTGDPAQVLAIASQCAQLVVLGVPGGHRSTLNHDVLRAAACPVLLAHAAPVNGVKRPVLRALADSTGTRHGPAGR